MRRALLALSLVEALVHPLPVYADEFKVGKNATVQTAFRASDIAVNFFLLPLAYAFALPHGGYASYPYQKEDGYASGDREIAGSLRTSRQFLDDGRQAQNAHFRVRGGNRLGWDMGLSSFDPRVFSADRAQIWSGHITASYLESKTALLEAGYGIASFQDPRPRTGFSFELNLEVFPKKPYTGGVRYQWDYLQSRSYHDVSVHVGTAWKHVGLSVGYRSFFNPILNVHGPEIALTGWF